MLGLTVGASGQESEEFAGEIHGVVVGQDGQPAKGMRLGADMQCTCILDEGHHYKSSRRISLSTFAVWEVLRR